MTKRGLLTLKALSGDDIRLLIDRTCNLATQHSRRQTLNGKRIGLLFNRVSTRTRTAFTFAAEELGAKTIHYGPSDLQLTTGESLSDTGLLLAQYLDCLVVRSYHTSDLEVINRHIPVVNALTEDEHPTQAIADLATISQERGPLRGLHILFLGEGGNIAKALCLAAAHYPGLKLTVATPKEYALPHHFSQEMLQLFRDNDATFQQVHDASLLPNNVDVVYTSRWQSMGMNKSPANWRDAFRPFQVNQNLMSYVGTANTIFLHDLPAERGAEVADEVLDGTQSRVLPQARNKLYGAMAVLEWVMTSGS